MLMAYKRGTTIETGSRRVLKNTSLHRLCERSEAILYVVIAFGFRTEREGGRGA
jgi:hypothetical protein